MNLALHHVVDFDFGISTSYAEKRFFCSDLLGPATCAVQWIILRTVSIITDGPEASRANSHRRPG